MISYSYDVWKNFKKEIYANCITTYCNQFVYKGYVFDSETGWYYLKSRYYDPIIRRFIHADDYSCLDNKSLTGINLYSYCGNNQINYVDSGGRLHISVFLIYLFAQRGHQVNMRLSKYRDFTDEQILEKYYELCKKGRLTKEEQEEWLENDFWIIMV